MTSSTRSRSIHPTPADREAWVAAVTNVCEQSFFALAEPATEEVIDRAADGDKWFEVVVDFSGPFYGSLYVAVPSALGRELYAAFLGCDDGASQPEEALEDLMGEFGNMACGAWLSGLGEPSCFALERPVVQLTDEPALVGATLMAVNEQPVAIGARLAQGR